MVIGGSTPRVPDGSTTNWSAAISSGRLTRDARMGKIRNMFEALDTDRDRVVTQEEFVDALHVEGLDAREAVHMFREIDESRTGRLTLAKFDHYVAVHTLAIVRDTFKKLDASHDRQIKREEFVRYFLGNGLSKGQARSLWDSMDTNRNGKINFVEYRDWATETLTTTSLDDIAVGLGLSPGA